MNKRKLLLILATASLLASCGNLPGGSTPAGSSPAQTTSQASQAQQSSQAEGGTSQASQAQQSSQAEGGTSQAQQSSQAQEDNIFGPVKESPVNKLTNDKILEVLVHFHEKAIETIGSSPFGENAPTAEFVAQFVESQAESPFALFMECNHFTVDEVKNLIDLVMPEVAKFKPSESGEGASQIQIIMEEVVKPAFKAKVIEVLEAIDLEKLFATLVDMEKDERFDLASIASLIIGGRGSDTKSYLSEAESLKDDVPEVAAYFAAEQDFFASRTGAPQMSVELTKIAVKDATLFPTLRFIKKLLVNGLKQIDIAELVNAYQTIMQWYSAFMQAMSGEGEVQTPDAEFLAAIGKIADVFAKEFVTAEEANGMFDLYFDLAIEMTEFSLSSTLTDSVVVEENIPLIKDAMQKVRAALSGRSFLSLFHFVGKVLSQIDQGVIDSVKTGTPDFASYAGKVEAAYVSLTAEQKADIKAITDFIGVDIDEFFGEVKELTADQFEEYFKTLGGEIMETLQVRFHSEDTQVSSGWYGNIALLQNAEVSGEFPGATFYTAKHGESNKVEVLSADTSKAGETEVRFLATFDDGYQLHAKRKFAVVPEALTGIGAIYKAGSGKDLVTYSGNGLVYVDRSAYERYQQEEPEAIEHAFVRFEIAVPFTKSAEAPYLVEMNRTYSESMPLENFLTTIGDSFGVKEFAYPYAKVFFRI